MWRKRVNRKRNVTKKSKKKKNVAKKSNFKKLLEMWRTGWDGTFGQKEFNFGGSQFGQKLYTKKTDIYIRRKWHRHFQ